jgi:dihydrofolate reductase
VTRAILVAMSPERVIGLHNTIPWHYRGDMLRFKRLTTGATIIMGRLTWESLPKKPLPNRRNVVITRAVLDGVDCFPSVEAALATTTGDVWFIGGARIYEEAMKHADVLDVTYVPDRIDHPEAVKFPEIDASTWTVGPRIAHEDEPTLERQEMRRATRA